MVVIGEGDKGEGAVAWEDFLNLSSDPNPEQVVINLQLKSKLRNMSSLLNGVSKYQRQVDIDLDKDVAVLPFSSGTTGVPKGVMLSQKNLVEYNILF